VGCSALSILHTFVCLLGGNLMADERNPVLLGIERDLESGIPLIEVAIRNEVPLFIVEDVRRFMDSISEEI